MISRYAIVHGHVMFFSFLSLSCSFALECNATLKHAAPVPDATLLTLVVLARHGHPTPDDLWLPKSGNGFWVCDSEASAWAPRVNVASFNGSTRRYATPLDPSLVEFPPNCQTGDLTLSGMQQLYELGTFYRNYLVSTLKFLPAAVNPDILKFRSSYPDRAFRSAVSFASGFYPPVAPGESLTVISGSSPSDFLFPQVSQCSDLRQDWASFQNTTEYLTRRTNAASLYAPVFSNLNKTMDATNWMSIGNWLASQYCSDQEIPDFITDAIFDQSLKDYAFSSYGLFNISRGNGGGPILREIFREIDASLNGTSKQRFFLFSAEGSSIAAVLSTFGINSDALPRYGAHLALEVWQTNDGIVIRFVLDGELVPIDLLEWKTLVGYQELKEKLQPFLNSCSVEYE
jgi:acid phosphatase